jgi:hypothetical protein
VPELYGPISGYNARTGARLVKEGKKRSDLVVLFDVRLGVKYSTVQYSHLPNPGCRWTHKISDSWGVRHLTAKCQYKSG